MNVELVGGPFDGETRDVNNPGMSLRVIVRDWKALKWQWVSLDPSEPPPFAHLLYAPKCGRPGELHYRGVIGVDDRASP